MNPTALDVCPFPPNDCRLLSSGCAECRHLNDCINQQADQPTLFDSVQRTESSGLLVPTQTSNDFEAEDVIISPYGRFELGSEECSSSPEDCPYCLDPDCAKCPAMREE
jgi:hypothetical protein